MKRSKLLLMWLAGMLILLVSSCRSDDEELVLSSVTNVTPGVQVTDPVKGFFLLNEGNMGSNKASLDYFDYASGNYCKNIYPELNPTVQKALGDVGNDIQINGDKLFAVINVSHLVEVMDVNTARHLAAIPIPNCRYIVFNGRYAYVSSYAGKVVIDPNARLGYVAKVDLNSLQVVDTCDVGYQPEEMVVVGNKLYVANSGGYRVPNYDNTVSVIDLNTFTEIKKITVGINLHRMAIDARGNIYVSSRGDYYDIHSKVYVINSHNDMVTDVLNFPASEFCLSGDSLFYYSTEYSKYTGQNTISYGIYDTRKKRVVTTNFITDGTEKSIEVPYGLAVNPDTKEIFVTDAKNYVTPGTLYCFTPEGKKKWSVTTGDIPAHFVFTTKRLQVTFSNQ